MNQELVNKARKAESVEELLALAKENGIELTNEQAKEYFAQLNPTKGELSDDELEDVAGGGCETKVDGKEYTVVTAPCKCFTGEFLCNIREGIYIRTVYAHDHEDLRIAWYHGTLGGEVCGQCAHLCFKNGLGYCGKS